MKKYKVIDLFAGVGGLSYGFSQNNRFEIVAANEYDKDIALGYVLNHPEVKMINCDIKDLTDEMLLENNVSDIDIIVGGPPCQSYSTLGKRKMDDRAHLFEEYCRILQIVNPRIFVFENVTGLLSMQNGKLINIIKEEFARLGYETKMKVLNAVNYGVPQYRERVIIVGVKGTNNYEYPSPTHGEERTSYNDLIPYITVEDALSDMPILESGQESIIYATEPQNDYQRYLRKNSNYLTENSAPQNGQHLIEIMRALPDGGTKEDLPESIRPKSGYGNTYAKMWWKKPAPTVTRNFATPSSSRCVHPRDSRALTTREGARLQSFPDDYKFYGSKTTKNLQIGNAVPPLLSIAIANQIEKIL